MHQTNMNELCALIRQWGEAKGITGKLGTGTLTGQLEKTEEELNETKDAAYEYEDCILAGEVEDANNLLEEIKDGIGDQFVTLVLAAELAGLHIEDCVEFSYNQIKDRTGKMLDGKFFKD